MCDTLAATTEARKAAAEDEDDEDDCAEAPAAVASASAQATSPLDSVSKVLTNSESELDEEVGPPATCLVGTQAQEFQRAMEAQLAANELPVAERPVAVEAVGFDLRCCTSAAPRRERRTPAPAMPPRPRRPWAPWKTGTWASGCGRGGQPTRSATRRLCPAGLLVSGVSALTAFASR